MDVEMSKKTKLALLAGVFVLAFPIYALSDSGMNRWVQGCWERPDATETPGRLIFLA